MEKTSQEFDLYKDIRDRTDGEIYIGVVGPVRTGKSTFIKQFMDLCVLPYLEDSAKKERMVDELPQSAQGRTIMTTEPKFIPQEAVTLALPDGGTVRVRLIDCVGYMVEGASGHLEGEGARMVRTPWSEEEIPFTQAAQIGTEKVISDHATLGVVVTTDGSIGELPRENYLEAEQKTIAQLKSLGKPFVVLLNCERPYAEETQHLAREMEQTYQAAVLPMNCRQMRREDMIRLLDTMLMEFTVEEVHYFVPKWMETLPPEHGLKQTLIDLAMQLMDAVNRMRDINAHPWESADFAVPECVSRIRLLRTDPGTGTAEFGIDIEEQYYYNHISEMAGVEIRGEYELITLIRELSGMKEKLTCLQSALESVEQKGYGVVMPGTDEISMENPVLIQHGSRYGVKMKAVSPSIHMIKANIETEIAPIVGNKEQAEDLIAYIEQGEQEGGGVWNTNIFGKSVGELMEDGIRSKIQKMDDEIQMKLQETMQKIVNESSGGLICLII